MKVYLGTETNGIIKEDGTKFVVVDGTRGELTFDDSTVVEEQYCQEKTSFEGDLLYRHRRWRTSYGIFNTYIRVSGAGLDNVDRWWDITTKEEADELMEKINIKTKELNNLMVKARGL